MANSILGSRAAVLRRSELTCLSSANDDEVGGSQARSGRSERSQRRNQTSVYDISQIRSVPCEGTLA